MSIRVRIPTPLRPHAGGQAAVSLPGETVKAVLAALVAQAPGLQAHLLAEDGSLRSFVNVYVNGEDVRARSGLETPLLDGDELAIVPAIAGGATAGTAAEVDLSREEIWEARSLCPAFRITASAASAARRASVKRPVSA